MVRTHQPGQTVFRSVLPEDIEWKAFPAFPPSVRLAVIVGEPTDLEVVDGHKSVNTFTTTVHGHEAHSAKPYLGASAVMTAAELVCELNRIGDEMMERADPGGRFDPPYTTVHVGMIAGGTARNIISKDCFFDWEFRGLPDLDPQEIPDRLDRFVQGLAGHKAAHVSSRSALR